MDTPTVIFHSEIPTDQSISSLISGIVPPPNITLFLRVEELIICRNVPRSVQRGHTQVARPPNCFMIYRKNCLAGRRRTVNDGRPFNMSSFSKEIAAKWKTEPPEVVNFYTQMAEIVRGIHSKVHPHYKYTPRKAVKRRKAKQDIKTNDKMTGSSQQRKKRKKEENVVSEFQVEFFVHETNGDDNASSNSNDTYYDCGEELLECPESSSSADEFNHLLNNMDLRRSSDSESDGY
ncbi:6408_t:CDS:1 [Paraglomus occultum]|uniref:6408_t:CDS:1 n=1 Tax=Paraglomus occultum TaxID=144539 RepID=A0A9N8VSW3_9GLOM|nr:6408_t:CDS:1 [Paraglomus occultum]